MRTASRLAKLTATSAVLIAAKTLQIPFPIHLSAVTIEKNISGQLGGGLRAGNAAGGPTLPIGLKIADTVNFQLNRTKSQEEDGDDLWVTWAGITKANDRHRPEKLVLR